MIMFGFLRNGTIYFGDGKYRRLLDITMNDFVIDCIRNDTLGIINKVNAVRDDLPDDVVNAWDNFISKTTRSIGLYNAYYTYDQNNNCLTFDMTPFSAQQIFLDDYASIESLAYSNSNYILEEIFIIEFLKIKANGSIIINL